MSRIYYINTENRLSGNHSNFTYKLQIPANSEFNRVCVLQASIPVSFYLIQDGYNTFTVQENVARIITIPAGNYNAQNFIPVLVNLLNTGTFIYSATLDYKTAKYTFTVSSNDLQPSFIFSSHLSQQLGFNKNSTNTFSGDTLKSINTLNFIPEGTIYIHSDLVDDETDVLQEVYANNTIPFSNCIYQLKTDVNTYSKKLRTNASNVFRFYLCNEEDNELNLNGQNLLITIMLFKKDDFTDIFKKYIKYIVSKNENE
jgi:hypothetical protein